MGRHTPMANYHALTAMFLRWSAVILAVITAVLLGLVPSSRVFAAEEAQVVLNGNRLTLTTIIISEDEVLLPLEKVANALGGTVTVGNGQVEVKLGRQTAVFTVGSREVATSGGKVTGAREVQARNGTIYVPSMLAAQALGLKRTWDSDRHILTLRLPLASLEAVNFREEGGHPVISLITDRVVTYTIHTLAQPDRLVVDLADTQPGSTLTVPSVSNPLVKTIRVSQFSATVTRVVVELVRSVGVKAEADPAMPQQLNITLPVPITDVDFERVNGQGRLLIKGEGGLVYNVLTLAAPPRLAVDLPDTVLVVPDKELDPHDSAVKLIRLSQYNPNQVRVVMDLIAPLGFQTVLTPTSDQVALNLVDQVVGLSVKTDRSGGRRISIMTTGGGPPVVMRATDPERLVVDIPQTVLGITGGTTLPINDGLVKQVQTLQFSPQTVRVVVELAHAASYQLTGVSPTEVALDLQSSPVDGRRITIDAGHGGKDPGAIGHTGLKEKDVVLDIALRVEALLRGRGAEVVMTRRDDTFVGLYDRPAIANAQPSEVFLSIHANSSRNTASGTEAYYYPGRDDAKALSELIADEFLKLGLSNRWVHSIKEFVVTRETNGTAVLFEVAFISNRDEEKLLADPDSRQKMAEAMVRALERFFATRPLQPLQQQAQQQPQQNQNTPGGGTGAN